MPSSNPPRSLAFSTSVWTNGLVDASSRWIFRGLVGLLILGAATLWHRHQAMALRRPLDGLALLAAGALVMGMAIAARLLFRFRHRVSTQHATSHTIGFFVDFFILVCLIAWNLAFSATGSDAGVLAILWTGLVVEETWAWRIALRWDRWRAPLPKRPPGEVSPAEQQIEAAPFGPDTEFAPFTDATFIFHDNNVLQQFVRSRHATGGEVFRGWVRVPLRPGQRHATVHVAFCPPFRGAPKLNVAQRVGPSSRVRIAQALPLGVRLDVKLERASPCDTSLVFEIIAQTDGSGELSQR